MKESTAANPITLSKILLWDSIDRKKYQDEIPEDDECFGEGRMFDERCFEMWSEYADTCDDSNANSGVCQTGFGGSLRNSDGRLSDRDIRLKMLGKYSSEDQGPMSE